MLHAIGNGTQDITLTYDHTYGVPVIIIASVLFSALLLLLIITAVSIVLVIRSIWERRIARIALQRAHYSAYSDSDRLVARAVAATNMVDAAASNPKP